MQKRGLERRGGAAELRTRLLWFTLFRLAANTLSLAAISIRLVAERPPALSSLDIAAFATVGLIYSLSIGYSFRLRFFRVGQSDAIAQVSGDLIIATALVFLTGGAESPFNFTFSVAVIGAALLLGLRGALSASAASFALYTAVALAIHAGLMTSPMGGEPLTTPRLLFLLVSHGLAVLAVGTLSGYLSRQLASAGGRLVEREEDLRSLGELHRQILEAMPSGLVTADTERRVAFANPTAEGILGRPDGTLVGELLDTVIPGVTEFGPLAMRRELSVRTPAGRRVLGLSVTPMVAGPGAILLVFQDLTELRRLEHELQRADRLAALGHMAAQLAHEIRNPLAAMRGSAQLVAEEAADNPVVSKLSKILVRESDRLDRLVGDVLRFARPASPAKRSVSVSGLVDATVQMLRTDPMSDGIRMEIDAAEEVFAIVDPDQLRQVLLNLIRNGLQAASSGGCVRIEVSSGDDVVVLRVWDSGGGVPPELMPRLFEPFFSTRQGGSGLGLATAHAIIRAHSGRLEVLPSKHGGTEFVIELPRYPPTMAESPVPGASDIASNRRLGR